MGYEEVEKRLNSDVFRDYLLNNGIDIPGPWCYEAIINAVARSFGMGRGYENRILRRSLGEFIDELVYDLIDNKGW